MKRIMLFLKLKRTYKEIWALKKILEIQKKNKTKYIWKASIIYYNVSK